MERNILHFLLNKWHLKDGSFPYKTKNEKKKTNTKQKRILQNLASDKGEELNSSG